MVNHFCDVLVVAENYKCNDWDIFHNKNLKVYEVVGVCSICGKFSLWLEYRYYEDDCEFKVL